MTDHTLTQQQVQAQQPEGLLSVLDYCLLFPQYEFFIGVPLAQQRRIYGGHELWALPVELSPYFPYRRGGAVARNLNNTRTHYQCKDCRRVLRNDCYPRNSKWVEGNVMPSRCNDCQSLWAAKYHKARSKDLSALRLAVLQYLSPACLICGYDKHVAAIDMHHLGDKEQTISRLLTTFVGGRNPAKGKQLLDEAEKCVAICANCHRLLHIGEISLPPDVVPRKYDLDELVAIVSDNF